MNIQTTLLCAAALAAISLSSTAQAKTYVIPHVLESSGSMSFTLPGGGSLDIRESPTRQSLGRVVFDDNGGTGGAWRIGSFFDIFTEISLDGGEHWAPQDATTFTSVSTASPIAIDEPGAQVFDTEMLALDLRESPTLPSLGQFMLRESPTLASTGKGHVTVLKNATCSSGVCSDGYAVDSFFDVFTELSLDGGQTWTPSRSGSTTATIRMSSTPVPAAAWMLGSGLLGLVGAGWRRR